MKPPICEVCNARFSAKEGALVTCVGDERSQAWVRKQAEGSFPGHPPNRGWFCSDHHEEAQTLAELLTLPQVIASIRAAVIPSDETAPVASDQSTRVEVAPRPVVAKVAGNERTCDVCGITFEKDTAGLVRFAHTRKGNEWHQAMIRGEVSGTNPDHAWLCARHITPALRISSTLDRTDAMAELMPRGRDPLEYDERPASADPNTSTFPGRMSFQPVANDGLDNTAERWVDIAPHPPKAVHAAVLSACQQFGEALGVSDLRNSGSGGSAASDPADTRWAADGEWVGSSVAPHQAGDVVAFVIRQTFRTGDQSGPILRQGLRLLIQKRERSIYELTFLPADPPTVALDGLVMTERVLVRQSPTLAGTVADQLEAVLGELVVTLSAEIEDPLALEPDLVGVDLGSGTIARKHFDDGSTVDWSDIAPTFERALALVFDSLPVFFDVLGSGVVPELEFSVNRTWNPMDGAGPPDCPFSETKEWKGSGEQADVSITHHSSHWNEHQVANQSVHLLIQVDGGTVPLRLSVGDRTDDVHLTLQRPTSAELVAATRSHFGC